MTPFFTVFIPLVTVYFALGMVAAAVLVFGVNGLQRIDPVAGSGTLGFKLLVWPGCAALWPWVLLRFLRHQPIAPNAKAQAEGSDA